MPPMSIWLAMPELEMSRASVVPRRISAGGLTRTSYPWDLTDRQWSIIEPFNAATM